MALALYQGQNRGQQIRARSHATNTPMRRKCTTGSREEDETEQALVGHLAQTEPRLPPAETPLIEPYRAGTLPAVSSSEPGNAAAIRLNPRRRSWIQSTSTLRAQTPPVERLARDFGSRRQIPPG